MTTQLEQAARLALEALEEVTGWQWAGPMRVIDEVEDAITALRAALDSNQFNPDWDTQSVLVEEGQRMAKEKESAYQRGYMDGMAKGRRLEQEPAQQPRSDYRDWDYQDLQDAALEQPAQDEPIAFCKVDNVYDNDSLLAQLGVKRGDILYTRPQAREPLTDEVTLAIKQGIEALEIVEPTTFPESDAELFCRNAITALSRALEHLAQQKPVAYGMWDTQLGRGGRMMMVRLDKGQDGCTVPLYAAHGIKGEA